MAPEAGSKYGAPVLEFEVFRTQMYWLKEVLVTLLGLFGAIAMIRRPGNRAPFVPLRKRVPLMMAWRQTSLWQNNELLALRKFGMGVCVEEL